MQMELILGFTHRLWEKLHNRNFKPLEFEEFKRRAGANAFTMSPKKWIEATDAIKSNLIPPELTPAQVAYTYASEADLLNVVLFGKRAKQWKSENSGAKGNIRDSATLNQLLVLANLESYNAVLISQGKSQKERMELLRRLALQQLHTLESVSMTSLPASR